MLQTLARLNNVNECLKDCKNEHVLAKFHEYFIHSLSKEDQFNLISLNGLNTDFFEEATVYINSCLEGYTDTSGILELALPTEQLLANGGDDRLHLKPSANGEKTNKYNGSTIPRPDMISRASCTCSTVTENGYEIAKTVQHRIITKILNGQNNALSEENKELRSRLHGVLGLSEDSAAVMLFPSGSDAELLPTTAALVRHYNINQQRGISVPRTGGCNTPKVISFIVAAGEVGSGTSKASGGKHFSNAPTTADDTTVSDGKLLQGLSPGDVEVVEYKARAPSGSVHLQEADILANIRHRLASGDHTSVAILHVVCGTKTGLVYPSLSTVQAAQQEFGNRLLVVVDACQLRCHLSMIKQYVDMGALVLFTGSKFFCGPPFSGAVTFPASIAREIEQHISSCGTSECVVPMGLQSYLTPNEVPSCMPQLAQFLVPSAGCGRNPWSNPGLTLRWSCALDTMEKYAALPPLEVAAFTRAWVENIRRLVEQAGPYLSCLQEVGDDGRSGGSEMPGEICSIVSVLAHVPDSYGALRTLSFDEMKALYVDMTQGCSPRTLLGQPVLLSSVSGLTVLRIALGADMVVRALRPCSISGVHETAGVRQAFSISTILQEDAQVVEKFRSLCERRWPQMRFFGAVSPHQNALVNRNQEKMVKSERTLCPGPGAGFTSECTTTERLEMAVKALQKSSGGFNVAVLYDADALHNSYQRVQDVFPKHFTHCYAVKSCPTPYVLYKAVAMGLGLEAASISEVKMGLMAGCAPEKIVFDSPCKTKEEILEALLTGVSINANTLNEVEKIHEVLAELKSKGLSSMSTIGVRINPLVGSGAVAQLSTATTTSKFGVQLTAESRECILDCYQKHPFLTMVMSHIGSGGVTVEQLCTGAKALAELADDIDARCCPDGQRISTIDIGGGLPVNYESDEAPVFLEYANLLQIVCPSLMIPGRRVVTEFGKSLVLKTGAVVTKVEDIVTSSNPADPLVAIVHAGADLFVRPTYVPEKFFHRTVLYSTATGEVSDFKGKTEACINVSLGGPLCHSADIIETTLPTPSVGDYVIILDGGGNTLSLFSKHCSRLTPAVYAFSIKTGGSESKIITHCVKDEETIDNSVQFFG